MYCAWTVATKFDLSNNFQPINAHCALFTDPQISLFNNFFIKNGSHNTIHIFKNYFATVFSNFQFQFSAISKQTLRLELVSNNLLLLTYLYTAANYLYYLNSYSQLQKLSNLTHPDVAKWWTQNTFPDQCSFFIYLFIYFVNHI